MTVFSTLYYPPLVSLTDPVIMSYIRVPRLHQSTALLCPNLVRISGALKKRGYKKKSCFLVFLKVHFYSREHSSKTEGCHF